MQPPPRPGEDNELRSGEWASESDSVTKEISTKKKKEIIVRLDAELSGGGNTPI